MKRYVIIEDGRVVGIAHADKPHGENWVKHDLADIGWRVCLLPELQASAEGGGGGPIEPP